MRYWIYCHEKEIYECCMKRDSKTREATMKGAKKIFKSLISKQFKALVMMRRPVKGKQGLGPDLPTG